ncbi:hypothetical protein J2X12_004244 [Pseudarthrobacter oxydans]|uniref:Uncharacterized protein n=1 Tax=Pseudarthrobacter oxydans TaxID=1671 RepID=A0AAW8NHH3_PSEOX|nr:hypothetical protein [Pseudarthrobacter oxydans]MDR6794753.1 hypothetical protein [Pseudarthrobacter oxydans]MDR7166190.1 hypothetical protein [Pseudarthrobacter oxydans]
MEELDELEPAIERELQDLIQDQGLTPSRVEKYAPKLWRAYPQQTSRGLCDVVRAAIEDLPDDKYTRSLKFALNIGNMPRHSGLTDRRAFFNAAEGANVSEDTIRRWERRAMLPLARALVRRAAQPPAVISAHVESVDERIERLNTLIQKAAAELEELKRLSQS